MKRCSASIQGRQGGFTLIELMTVMVISSLMLAVVAPRLGDFLQRRQIDEGARQLRYVVEYARQLSLAEAAPVAIRVNADWNQLSLWISQDGAGKVQESTSLAASGTLARYRIPDALTLLSVRRDDTSLARGVAFQLDFEPLLVPQAWELVLEGKQEVRAVRIAAGGGGVRIEAP